MILTWGEIEWDKYLSRYIYVHMNGYSPPVKTQGLEFDTLMWLLACSLWKLKYFITKICQGLEIESKILYHKHDHLPLRYYDKCLVMKFSLVQCIIKANLTIKPYVTSNQEGELSTSRRVVLDLKCNEKWCYICMAC